MELTSAAANKMLKALEDEKAYVLAMESEASVYVLADGEEVEPPAYDYEAVQIQLEKIDSQTRKLKHAINVFNIETKLEGLNVTIDEALVEMAQLNKQKARLDLMRKRLPKTRSDSNMFRGGNQIEYVYVNYEIHKVQQDYQKVSERITAIQMALDMCNQTKVFSVELS